MKIEHNRHSDSTDREQSRNHICEAAGYCGMTASKHVTHPQRGTLAVCVKHARRIRNLPSDIFEPGAGT